MKTISYWITIDDNTEEKIEVPAKEIPCKTCNSRGSVDPPAHNLDDPTFDNDPEIVFDYMQGTYDVECPICEGDGNRVVPDEALMTTRESELVALAESQQRAVNAFGVAALISYE